MIYFAFKGVAQSTTETMQLVGYTAEVVYYEPDGMALGDMVTFAFDPITQGTIFVTLYRNGSEIATVALSQTAPRGRHACSAKYLDPGDRLSATAQGSADLAPDGTNDVVVIVQKG